MISQLLVILGFSTLSALAWGSNTSVHGQFALGGAPWCTGLGDSTIDTLASFRLYAWYKDLPNSNSAGVPLVLATTGATAGTYSHTLATLESQSRREPTEFFIVRGGITAKTRGRTVATSFNPGDPAFFYTSDRKPLRDPRRIFCVVPNNSVSGNHPYPYLAVHRSYNKFHLCPDQLTWDSTIWKVVYDISSTSYYDTRRCRSVLLNVVY